MQHNMQGSEKENKKNCEPVTEPLPISTRTLKSNYPNGLYFYKVTN